MTQLSKDIIGGIEGSNSERSKLAYKKRQEHFTKYLLETQYEFCENVMINYFTQISNKSTKSLWTYYSMLNSYTKVTYNKDLNRFFLLRECMKKLTKSNLPSKAPVFEQKDIDLILDLIL